VLWLDRGTAFEIAWCLLLKSSGLKTAATFSALRWPVVVLALGLLVPLAVLGRRVVLLLARGNLARLLVLLGAGRGCLRRCRRRA
jgi:fumarate reductase subunit D